MEGNIYKFIAAGMIDAPANAKLLYLLMDENSNASGEMHMSRKRIGAALGISPAAVTKNMHRLAQLGYISIIPTYNSDGGRSVNKYVLRK